MQHYLQFYLDQRALEATNVWDDQEQLVEIRGKIRDELAIAMAMVQRIEDRLGVLQADARVRGQFAGKAEATSA